MACNFNIDDYTSICADVAGVAGVSIIPAQNVKKVTIAEDIVTGFEYEDKFNKWAKFDVMPGKGNIQLAATIDPKKQVYFNVYTLVFNLNSFNANIIKHGPYLTGEFLALVKLNNGKVYLLGANEDTFNDLKITGITSTTGAAMGDAQETVITMTYRTSGRALECGNSYAVTSAINQSYDYVK